MRQIVVLIKWSHLIRVEISHHGMRVELRKAPYTLLKPFDQHCHRPQVGRTSECFCNRMTNCQIVLHQHVTLVAPTSSPIWNRTMFVQQHYTRYDRFVKHWLRPPLVWVKSNWFDFCRPNRQPSNRFDELPNRFVKQHHTRSNTAPTQPPTWGRSQCWSNRLSSV